MTDGEALLRAVLAAPDEDTPRLIYADWLQENGQPEKQRTALAQAERDARGLERFPALPSAVSSQATLLGAPPQRQKDERCDPADQEHGQH